MSNRGDDMPKTTLRLACTDRFDSHRILLLGAG
jgi:hypothetical protein